MIESLKRILKPKYQTLNKIEILKDNLIHNLNYLYSLQEQAEMFPVLKSNAYGHGLKEISKILDKTRVKMVAVDSFPEAQIVYKYFSKDLLILNEMPLKAYKYSKFKRTEFVVYNQETLRYLAKKFGKKIKIHLFLNTGMNREGIDNLEKFVNDNLKYIEEVNITGFCSHLSESDNPDSDFNKKQEELFLLGLETLNKYKIYPKWIHLGNSGGVFLLKNKRLNSFRPGLSFYGYSPFNSPNDFFNSQIANLKPALRVFSTITSIHKVKTGERVSYSNSFRAEQDISIATIPFGYFEGLDRRLSNCAKFLFTNKNNAFWAKIAGNICMNLTCINCLDREVKLGDEIKLISEIKDMDNSIENLSKKIDIINYEMLIRLNNSIKRIII
ncbi:MAG TPA: alanine racemase [bacterium]|nr:alanine racemase [bacterium]